MGNRFAGLVVPGGHIRNGPLPLQVGLPYATVMVGPAYMCGFRRHRPGDRTTVNGSLAVSRCARCGQEIISRNGYGWRTVPPGKRIVWREPDAHEMTWPIQILPPRD